MIRAKMRGGPELQAYLRSLGPKIERQVLSAGLRAAAQVIRKDAQGRIDSHTGLLRKSLKLSVDRYDGTIVARIKAKGPHAYIAPFVEFGTAAHVIVPKKGKKALFFDGKFAASANHTAVPPHPFLRPAIDLRHDDALKAFASKVAERLEKKNLEGPALEIIDGEDED